MKELEFDQLRALYRRCFATPEGEVVLADLERRYQLRSSLGNLSGGGGVEPVLAREGERNVYLYVAMMAGKLGGEDGNTDKQ